MIENAVYMDLNETYITKKEKKANEEKSLSSETSIGQDWETCLGENVLLGRMIKNAICKDLNVTYTHKKETENKSIKSILRNIIRARLRDMN